MIEPSANVRLVPPRTRTLDLSRRLTTQPTSRAQLRGWETTARAIAQHAARKSARTPRAH